MSQALADVVVLDLTTEFWGSLGAAMLGDFGARVIRVEPLGETRERTSTTSGTWDPHGELAPSRSPPLVENTSSMAGASARFDGDRTTSPADSTGSAPLTPPVRVV